MSQAIGNAQKQGPFIGYVQLSPLKANNFAKGVTYAPSIMVGGGIETEHVEIKLEAGYSTGSVLDASVEFAPKFTLNKDWTLATGLKFAYAEEVGKDKNSATMINKVAYNDLSEESVDTITWNEQSLRGGLKAEARYSKKNLNIGLGLEGGLFIKGPEVSMHSEVYVGNEQGGKSQISKFERKDKKGAYITPTVSADYQLGKGFSLNLKANAFEGNAGIRYTF